MFNAFEYFSRIYVQAGIAKIEKCSGLAELEGYLSNVRNIHENVLMVRDSGDGHLDMKVRRLDTSYHTLYIMVKGTATDATANMTAKRNAMTKGIKLFELMKKDAEEFGDLAYGFDDSRIDYSEIGPIGNQFYGYAFSFTIEHQF